ncbi:hypothetical protein OROMI_012524 [Orobanche minor]
MAMSRILFQSLTRPSLRFPISLISNHRHHSNKAHHAQLIELDLESASSSQYDSPEAAAEVIRVGIKKLEEAIHSIIVRRAAPGWLPFLPGYSYWVPPHATSMRSHSANNMIEVVRKLASPEAMRNGRLQEELLTEDEQMSFMSAKGWPSSAVFIEDLWCLVNESTSPVHPIPVIEVQMQVEIQDYEDSADNTSRSSEDEEG